MNWASYGWIVGLLITIVIQSATAIFVYGKLTQTVSEHDRRIANAEVKLDDHGHRITRLEVQPNRLRPQGR